MRFLISCIAVAGLMLIATGPSANAGFFKKLTPEQKRRLEEQLAQHQQQHQQQQQQKKLKK